MKRTNDKNTWIFSIILVLIFSFFMGYYFCYRINEKEKSKIDIIKEILEEEWYYGKYDENFEETLENKIILGMMDKNTDPFTLYMTSLGSLADSFIGIGIEVSVYGEYFAVSEVNSVHAIEDGIKVGDILVKVNDIDLKNKSLDELKDVVMSCDNEIALSMIRDGQDVVINTSIVEYTPVTIFSEEYDNISYVRISEFNKDTAGHLKAYFDTLSNDYNDLILDLRENPGGYITSVRDVLDLFVPSNRVVMTTVDKNGDSSVIRTLNNNFYLFDSITVLINEESASGAEALAAALDYHLDDIVTLYGNTTYGKGSAQTNYTFADGTYFHYTYALWYTPDGTTINKKGVAPEVESSNEGISSLDFSGKQVSLYDYGDDVKYVQEFLNLLGYDVNIHSFFDEKMQGAVIKYQEDYGLEVTGSVDVMTIRHMQKLIYDDLTLYMNNELNAVLERLGYDQV